MRSDDKTKYSHGEGIALPMVCYAVWLVVFDKFAERCWTHTVSGVYVGLSVEPATT